MRGIIPYLTLHASKTCFYRRGAEEKKLFFIFKISMFSAPLRLCGE
jgi:hypothetical protein